MTANYRARAARAFLVLLAGTFLWSCAGGDSDQAVKEPPAVAQGGPLGQVGGVVITPEIFEGFAYQMFGKRPGDVDEQDRRELLQKSLFRSALALEAEEKGLSSDPRVEQGMLRWKAETYPDWYWNNVVRKNILVSEEELRAFVDPQEQFLISAIVLDLSEEGEEEARQVHALLEGGADFRDVAREHSQGILAEKGGDMDWQNLPSAFIGEEHSRIIRELKPGEFSAPVEGQIGWLIYHLRDYGSADEVFEGARAISRDELLNRKFSEAKRARREELHAEASITIHSADQVAAGAPLAIVDGFAVTRGNVQGPRHGTGEVIPQERLLARFLDAWLIIREMEENGLDDDTILAGRRQAVRTKILSGLAVEAGTAEAAAVSEEDLRAEYERYAARPQVFQVVVVVVPDRGMAEGLLAEVAAGKAFADMAREVQEEKTAGAKASYSQTPVADIPPEILESLEALADGEHHTGAIDRGDGTFSLMQRRALVTVEVPPFEEASPRLRKQLERKKRADAATVFIDEYSRNLDIQINEELLRNF